ncbi:hypothetical protein IT412_04695 [Candidatus Peregrinibacteria bacterium]|nr:hypothetical protein [Candidatus Peregrinibacteria bacterium]
MPTQKLARTKQILQSWVDQQGHNRCWYYPELFRELVELYDIKVTKEPTLPPLEEFKAGCCRYQKEEFNL